MNAKIDLVRMAALALILPPEATRVIALRVSKERNARRVRRRESHMFVFFGRTYSQHRLKDLALTELKYTSLKNGTLI